MDEVNAEERSKVPFIAILTISFALLVDEIMLSAIFHVLLGAGNTVAAIAIALIGLSGSGVLAYSMPALHRSERAAVLYPKLLVWFSLSLIASAVLIVRIPISHGDLIYARGELAVQLWRLAVYHIAVVPFALGGLTIALLLRSHAERVSRLYFCDLAGAALGCLASPLLLSTLGAPAAILCGALPASALAAWLAIGGRTLPRTVLLLPPVLLALGALGTGLGSFGVLNTMGEVRAPAYRSFPIKAGDIEFERWALDAWTIIRSDRIPQQWENFEGWGLSPRYSGRVPRLKLVNYNARFSTYVTEYDGDLDAIRDWLDSDLGSAHYQIGRSYERVLNIGAGGGREVLNALHHGANRVVAVDVSDVVVNDIMKGYLRDFNGNLYLDPRVTALADEGRTFAERSRESFDLIDFSIVGGMNLEKMDLVRVDDLFTLEALQTYVSRLSAEGVFSYMMYTTRSDILRIESSENLLIPQPYVPALRTLAGLRVVLEEAAPGLRFSEHVLIAALRGIISPRYDLVHIVASKSPFTADERQRFLELCRELEFSVLYPRVTGSQDPRDPYAGMIEAADLADFAGSLPFSIWPVTDDRPFQYALDWSHVARAFDQGALLALLAENPLTSLAASIGLLAVLVTLVPLIVIRMRRGPVLAAMHGRWSLLAYFALIGFGYMAVEIAALLRLQSYLGKPIYGLSVGLFAFLISSGLGSAVTGRFLTDLPGHAYRVVLLVIAIGLGFFWLSESLFSTTLSFQVSQRALIGVTAIFPLAFPMGMLFPIGIKLIARESEDLIPWAWATNGCMSVLGIFGTRITAVFFGFSRALLLGLLAYALVAACVFVHSRLASRQSTPH